MTSKRIAVVGGGIVGLSCALELTRAGHAVTVLEPSITRDAASWGNAGHIATEQVAPLASLAAVRSAPGRLFLRGGALAMPPGMARHWLPFAARLVAASTPARFAAGGRALAALLADALPAWQRLGHAIGQPELVRADGHLVAWESAESAARGRRAWLDADTGTAAPHDLAADEMQCLRELVRQPLAGGMRFIGTGQIGDLGQLADALEQAIERNGGVILRRTGTLRHDGKRMMVEGVPSDLVIVAAGARSGRLVAIAGHRAPLIAERGYHLRLAPGRWPETMPPVVFEDRSIIVTRYADTVQVAGFVELGTPDAPADPRKWRRLERHVEALGLPVGQTLQRWMGARPTLPDYLPAIGRSRRAPNLLYAFGHQHLGLTLAPVTAGLIRDLVADEAPAIDLAPFDLDRFGGRRARRLR